jgi:hypothetical protein
MALTPGGLPYPLGTDLVVNGDDAIKALATALDTRLPVGAGTSAAFVPWLGNLPNIVAAKVICHAAVATTDVNGVINVSFPTPFTTAVLYVAGTTRSGSANNPVVNGGGSTLATVPLIWPGNGNTSISFVYIAIGY